MLRARATLRHADGVLHTNPLGTLRRASSLAWWKAWGDAMRVHCSVPTTGLDPATGYKEVLHGLEGCKNMNPDLPNGCMASGPTVGIDQHGLWCGAAAP